MDPTLLTILTHAAVGLGAAVIGGGSGFGLAKLMTPAKTTLASQVLAAASSQAGQQLAEGLLNWAISKFSGSTPAAPATPSAPVGK